MKRIKQRHERRARRKRGIRKSIFGAPARPRLSVFRSLRHIYAQVIDDLSGRTLIAVSSLTKGSDAAGGDCKTAALVGQQLAEEAQKAGITVVVMDRSGYRYHGRIKALAEAARKGGLKL